MSSASDSTCSKSPLEKNNETNDTITPTEPSEGVLAGVKQQINSITGGSSVSEIQEKVTTIAGEKINDMKETVVPAAEEVLQNMQAQIRDLGSGKSEIVEGTIDQSQLPLCPCFVIR